MSALAPMKAPTHVPTTVLSAIVFDAAAAGSMVLLEVALEVVGVAVVLDVVVTVGVDPPGTRGGAV